MSLPCTSWLTTYDSREAWAADAQSGAPHFSVGSSTVYKLLELCPSEWGDVWTVYRNAQQGVLPSVESDAPQLQRGQDWEPAVVAYHAALLSLGTIFEAPLCRSSPPGLSWLRPSPDGFVMDDEEGWGVSECKVLHSSQARLFADGAEFSSLQQVEVELREGRPAMPLHYMAQCMTMLAATGLPWCDLIAVFSWDWNGPEIARKALGKTREEVLDPFIEAGAIQVKRVRVVRDEYALRGLVQRVAQLRELHMVEGIEPKPSSSGDFWQHLAEKVTGGVRPATQAETQAIEHYAELRRRRDGLEAEVAQVAAELGARIPPFKSLTIPRPGRDGRLTLTTNGQLRLSGI